MHLSGSAITAVVTLFITGPYYALAIATFNYNLNQTGGSIIRMPDGIGICDHVADGCAAGIWDFAVATGGNYGDRTVSLGACPGTEYCSRISVTDDQFKFAGNLAAIWICNANPYPLSMLISNIIIIAQEIYSSCARPPPGNPDGAGTVNGMQFFDFGLYIMITCASSCVGPNCHYMPDTTNMTGSESLTCGPNGTHAGGANMTHTSVRGKAYTSSARREPHASTVY